MRFCNGVDKNFRHHFVTLLAIASQKLASRKVLPYKNIHNNRDIFFDRMKVLIFFMNTVTKRHVKRLTECTPI